MAPLVRRAAASSLGPIPVLCQHVPAVPGRPLDNGMTPPVVSGRRTTAGLRWRGRRRRAWWTAPARLPYAYPL